MLRRGGKTLTMAAAVGAVGCVVAFAAAGGAAGEGCKERHCGTHSTATTATATVEAARPLAIASPSSTATAQTLFSSGFETGTYKPWTTGQASNYGQSNSTWMHFGSFNLDTQIVGQGRYSGRFQLPAWSGGRTRSQVYVGRPVNIGGDDYYSLMVYLPVGFTTGTSSFWGVSIAELNFQSLGMGGPTIALQAHSDHVTLAMQTGVATTTFPNYGYRSNADSTGSPNLPALYAIPRPMKLGVWHELVIHAHWATSKTGLVEVWHRLKGQTSWAKTVSLGGVPTLQTNPNGSYPLYDIDVIQAYRAASTAPVTVWLDGFSRTTSFNAAAANMP
jgi:hypothetical protein